MDRVRSHLSHHDLLRSISIPSTFCATPESTQLVLAGFLAGTASLQLSLFNRACNDIRYMCILLCACASTTGVYSACWTDTRYSFNSLRHAPHHIFLLGYLGDICGGMGSVYPIYRCDWQCRYRMGMDRTCGRGRDKERWQEWRTRTTGIRRRIQYTKKYTTIGR
jgi:hypothetical protein